jgi:hypothetical protein
MTTKQIPWTRFGFESVLIVSSILVALTVDSMWEYRKERDDEQVVLASLLIEFQRNKIELDDTQRSLAASHTAANRLLTFAGKSLTDEDKAVIEKNLDELYAFRTFDPSSGALSSLLSAGQLDILLNIELRTLLAGWTGLVSDYKDDEREVDYLLYRVLAPILDTVAPLPIVEGAAPGTFQSQWQGAFNDLRFLNQIGNLSTWTEAAVEEATLVGNEIDQIILLIESEVE